MKTRLIEGGIATDDRGSVRHINDFDFKNVKRFYQVENHRAGFIRAWHGHKREAKYVYIPKGSALVGAVDLEYFTCIDLPGIGPVPANQFHEPYSTVLSANWPKVLYIPAGYANGFKTLEPGTIVQFFSTSTFEEALEDDIRYEYDDPNIWEEKFR